MRKGSSNLLQQGRGNKRVWRVKKGMGRREGVALWYGWGSREA
jgi:hypothetical protein